MPITVLVEQCMALVDAFRFLPNRILNINKNQESHRKYLYTQDTRINNTLGQKADKHLFYTKTHNTQKNIFVSRKKYGKIMYAQLVYCLLHIIQ